MALKTKYITLDEFNQYFPEIDLVEELGSKEKALGFLKRIEVRMEAFLNANVFKLVTDYWPVFTDYQKEHYKYALLEQAIYVFRNGDISVDSGYDLDEGVKITPKDKKAIVLAPNAVDHLVLCGLWSRHITYPGNFGNGPFGNWFF